jgi:DNA polymerase III epsilon subunit-like protein
MSGLQYYIIDTETTGLSSSYHEMTEISIIKCSTRIQLTEFIKCDFPERANFDALAITKKTLADLEKGNDKEIVVERMNKFLNEDGLTAAHRCFVAHNWTFDKKFVHALYDKVGQKCPVDLWLCTMALTKAYAKQIGLVKPKVNLHAACDIVGLKKFADAHNSKVDSRNTYLLHRDLVEVKKVDYLPFIKTAVHQYVDPAAALAALDDDDTGTGLDPALLDVE